MSLRNYVPSFGEAASAMSAAGNAPLLGREWCRDWFIRAIEAGEFHFANAVRMHAECDDEPLSDLACAKTGLPIGATFADAAREL